MYKNIGIYTAIPSTNFTSFELQLHNTMHCMMSTHAVCRVAMRISGITAAYNSTQATEKLSETSEPDVSTTVALGPLGVTQEMDGWEWYVSRALH